MKTVARYLYPFFDETVPLDGSYISTLMRPSLVAVKEFIGYDPTQEVARGLVPGVQPVFARRILSSSATLAPQTVVAPMVAFANRPGSYYSVAPDPNGTGFSIALNINAPIITYTRFNNIPGGYNVKLNANHTLSIAIKV